MGIIEEQHERGATILKLRKLYKGAKPSPLLEEVGKDYGFDAEQMEEILGNGALLLLRRAGVPETELSGIEEVEAIVSDTLAVQHEANNATE